MVKIGIIGLGDIAQKAYLPLITKKKAEFHLCTRSEQRLDALSSQYRIPYVHTTIESLIRSGIHAAFIHSSTASHYDIAEELLRNNIHVYIEKPITYDYASAQKLTELATRKKLVFFTGFNRRYATAYQKLKDVVNPNMIIMQKNRRSLPAEVRTFVFDDFIHVIDTLLFLFPYRVEKMIVNGNKKDNMLFHIVVQFWAVNGAVAIGIMNRDSGTTEEKVEVFGPEEKRVVINMVDTVIHKDGNEIRPGISDWEYTLHKRGFDKIIDHFLETIQSEDPIGQIPDPLISHQYCEEIVARLSE